MRESLGVIDPSKGKVYCDYVDGIITQLYARWDQVKYKLTVDPGYNLPSWHEGVGKATFELNGMRDMVKWAEDRIADARAKCLQTPAE